MRRRDLILALSGAAIERPFMAVAQPFAQGGARQRRIGFLATWGEGDLDGTARLDSFSLRLRELGWTEGKHLQLAVRFGDNNSERIRQSAIELIGLRPEAIISTTSTTTRALMEASTEVPIVAAVSGDPIGLGFTKNLSRPTANVTGFTTFNDTLAGKRLEMLHEIVPAMRTAALMWVPANPQQGLLETQTMQAAKAQGIALLSLRINSADDIAAALTSIRDHKVRANCGCRSADPREWPHDCRRVHGNEGVRHAYFRVRNQERCADILWH